MSEAIAYLSFGDYIEGETRAPNRHERVGGRLFAMAGGSERHDLASGLIYETLAPGARRAGCRTFTANRILRTPSDAAYYPDVMVVCGPAWHRQYEKEAAVIVEVLSPSTAGVDRREKAIAYAAIPGLRLLLLVDPNERRIEVARPLEGCIASWEAYGPGQVIVTEHGDIDVDLLYDTIDQSATTT